MNNQFRDTLDKRHTIKTDKNTTHKTNKINNTDPTKNTTHKTNKMNNTDPTKNQV